mgnify:CR=1 FL=1
MISSNGLIIIEMVSSETVDRGTVLFILKGETCFGMVFVMVLWEVICSSRLYVFRGVVRLSPPKFYVLSE